MNASLDLLASMLPEDVDAALIISNENRRYFTQFVSSLGYLLLTREEAYLLVDFRYAEAAGANAKGCVVVPFKKLSEDMGRIITKHNIRSVMLEGSAFTLNDAAETDAILSEYGAKSIHSDELDKLITKLRITKTSTEVDKIIKAQRITEQALTETLRLVREGVTEKEIALELEYKMRRLGADGVSFDLIVIAGEKTSMPHGTPGNNKIKPGDFITFDIGALYEGYHSDMTRTYALGYVSDKQKRVYDTVYRAQKMGLDAVKGGVVCKEVDKTVRDFIYQAGFEGCFGHSTGHGVGLEIHEQPVLSQISDTILQSGMVVTVEPGIYIPGEFGVRIEDMAVVTTDGRMSLAVLPKELIIL